MSWSKPRSNKVRQLIFANFWQRDQLNFQNHRNIFQKMTRCSVKWASKIIHLPFHIPFSLVFFNQYTLYHQYYPQERIHSHPQPNNNQKKKPSDINSQTVQHIYKMVKFQPLKHSCDIMDLPFALRLAYYFPTAVILTSQSIPVSRRYGSG